MKLKEFIKTAYARFKAPTPAFWKSVQRKAARGAAMFVALGGLYQTVPEGMLPTWVIDAITYAGFACGVIAVVAQFACEDQPNQPAQ